MSIFNKLKNAFFEEELVEVEEKPKKEKKIAKKIEIPKKEEIIKEEELEILEPYEDDEPVTYRETELLKPETKIELFEDEDFADVSEGNIEEDIVKVFEKPAYQGSLYAGNTETKNIYSKSEKKVFQPTPIISPIYGIIEPGKSTVAPKKEVPKISYERNHVDLDTIRDKAFGDLASNLGLSGYDAINDEIEKSEIEDNLLYDLSDEEDQTPKVEKVTMADAEEYFEDLGLEYNIDYKDESKEKASGRRSVKNYEEKEIVSLDDESVEEEPEEEFEETAEAPVVLEKTDEIDDNLFDLIDLMYESKED